MFFGLAQLRKKKTQSRGRPIHFIYRVQLLEIKPWLPSKQPAVTSPSSCANSFILRWHRGDHRSGIAQTYHASCNGKIPFNHTFELPVTLYCSSSSSAFEEKLITFTLLDAEYSTGPPLAHGTLDLAAYSASGTGNDDPISTTVCIPLIICSHASSKAGIPNLHILITSSPCKRACFGDGKLQAKAQYLASYLPLQTARLLRKQEASPPPLDSRSHEALVAALLEEGDKHQEEEEEAEIEPFTDDESSSGLHTPPEDKSSHNKKNTTIVEGDDWPRASTRVSVAQVAWTPTPKRSHSDEMFSSLKTASEFYSSSKEVFLTSSCGVNQIDNDTLSGDSPASPGTNKRRLVEDVKLHNDDHKHPAPSDGRASHMKNPSLTSETITFLHQDAEAGEGQPTEKGNGKPTHVERTIDSSERNEGHIDAGLSGQRRISEAEALRLRIISQLHESKVCGRNFDNLDSELVEDNDIILVEGNMNVLEEARHKFAEGAEKRDAKITKRLLEETKVKLAQAEAKSFAASEKVSFLQLCIGGLEGELQDAAVIETFIFCTVAEHGGSPHSVLTCACHLAKLHKHAFTNWSHQRRASLMRSTFLGLILATRACGQDVARLTFWWSNVLALRHAFLVALNPESLPSSSEIAREASHVGVDSAKLTLPIELAELCDWGDPTIFCTALEKVEAWIYTKVVESIWCQVFAPLTQESACPPLQQEQQELSLENINKEDAVRSKDHDITSLAFGLEDEMPQSTSIDIWKKAYLDALEKLCPVQVGGKACSCIAGLPRLVIEECIARLDVLMFNAILPTSDMHASRNPVSDAVFEAQVLPIPPGRLTFGAGVQLKNVVSTWSTWLTILLEKLGNTAANIVAMDESRRFISFPLLKALADLLMLPRDMVADKCVRKEVCPVLTLPAVRRIISIVEPDEFAPDAVSPSLLAALNAEMEMEKRMYGDDAEHEHGFSAHGVALEPRVAYCSQTHTFKDLIGSTLDHVVSEWSMEDGGVNDALHDLKMVFTGSLQACHEVISGIYDPAQDFHQKHTDYNVPLHRYKLLQELWAAESTD